MPYIFVILVVFNMMYFGYVKFIAQDQAQIMQTESEQNSDKEKINLVKD